MGSNLSFIGSSTIAVFVCGGGTATSARQQTGRVGFTGIRAAGNCRPSTTKWRCYSAARRDSALKLEQQLRPTANIGWNKISRRPSTASRGKGIPKSPEQREKMRQAALRRWAEATPAALERQSKAVKKGLRGIKRWGRSNPRFGKSLSEQTKQKIRNKIAERGGVSGENNPNYRHGGYIEED